MTALVSPVTLLVRQGEDCKLQVPNIRDGNGMLIDPILVGSLKSQARSILDPFGVAGLLQEWSTAAGNLAIPTAGVVELTITRVMSSAWPWRYARFDVELTDIADKRARIAQGFIRVSPETTL